MKKYILYISIVSLCYSVLQAMQAPLPTPSFPRSSNSSVALVQFSDEITELLNKSENQWVPVITCMLQTLKPVLERHKFTCLANGLIAAIDKISIRAGIKLYNTLKAEIAKNSAIEQVKRVKELIGLLEERFGKNSPLYLAYRMARKEAKK